MATIAPLRVPSPADAPTMTAAELVERIRSQDGRVLRMKVPPATFCLTTNAALAAWLFDRGATCFSARGLKLDGSYRRAEGIREFDVWIHPIQVLGEQTVWEVAGR